MIEKILERLEEVKNYSLKRLDDEYFEGKATAYGYAIEIVQEVAKEYGKDTNVRSNDWIPCSERLPQEDEPVDVLCQIVNITLKDGTVTVGWCNRYLEKWFVLDWHCDYPVSREYEDVLAWMPLPVKYEPKDAPYQKGE